VDAALIHKSTPLNDEPAQIVARYARRNQISSELWTPVSPAVCMMRQEKERAVLRWIRECGITPLAPKRLLEVGCGSGANLLDFIRIGFLPENLVGNDLLPERVRSARAQLPDSLKVIEGNALELQFPTASFDVVSQSTVFTSILDDMFQEKLAREMWRWAIPGGGVLWYDFIYNNPRNPDVRGVPLSRIRHLFPDGYLRYWRVTLAPPISRIVTRIHPTFYTLVNFVWLFRTHVLCWIEKH